MRLGRQSVERELISEISWNVNKKLQAAIRNQVLDCLSFKFFTCNPSWMEEICDTPAEKLASRDPAGARAEEAWQTVGGKGVDFWNQLEC
ncbi:MULTISPECIES: hypothetical protein [unclassified Bacillus (in: firmicutes)]|uniref:hypothetical protein n=1 Tax=unclassified Bacillus (in: firmicutes) TaxID=185979 RepID=UPI001BE55DC0|nr:MULTISPECIES: hypothetical protein [unclassified Bacillus (in: firmicutes)]MBT2617597.1 hypothetical protein [Bacillus sp. ISL-78]